MKKKCNLETRDLIVTIIEKDLLFMGKRTHDKIVNCLKNEYDCKVSDCYAKPEILKLVLTNHMSGKLNSFMELIAKDLEKINYDKEITEFLEILRK
ncbi:MAG TPA: hypothetical protein VJ571_03630 [Candidatus Nitrosotalea sp.]|nr:hypothetical protein [Candidatus Nitrosotalea sp.]